MKQALEESGYTGEEKLYINAHGTGTPLNDSGETIAVKTALGEEKARQAVERILDEMELTSLKSRPVHTLSGGQKKQVSIADILVMEPELVILDEPASALDPRHTKLVQEAVKRMTDKGITVMISTHNVDFALAWADEAVVLKDGGVLGQGTPEEIFTDRELLSQANLSVPAALRLFDSLCRKGILDPSLPIPRNLDELESYLAYRRHHPEET